jgi:hypothetical protein
MALKLKLALAMALTLKQELKQQRYLRAVSWVWVGVQSVQSNELAGAP